MMCLEVSIKTRHLLQTISPFHWAVPPEFGVPVWTTFVGTSLPRTIAGGVMFVRIVPNFTDLARHALSEEVEAS